MISFDAQKSLMLMKSKFSIFAVMISTLRIPCKRSWRSLGFVLVKVMLASFLASFWCRTQSLITQQPRL